MSKARPTKPEVKNLLTTIGYSLPDRKRITGTTTASVKVVPGDVLRATSRLDTFEVTGTVLSKNNLEGKKVALVFGRESHPLTRTFFIPKLAMIYRNLTEKRDDVEFIFVSRDESETEFKRFTKPMPWPVLPWEEDKLRAQLTSILYEPLKKGTGYGADCGVVILDSDHETILNPDAESYISKTHDDSGAEFPFEVSAAENCCGVAATLVMCTIM
eukprot:jgi/Psemu1/300500/fgenesh1_kg.13_\